MISAHCVGDSVIIVYVVFIFLFENKCFVFSASAKESRILGGRGPEGTGFDDGGDSVML